MIVPATTRTLRTRTGLALVADERGVGDGPAVVFAHGGGQTRHSWGDAAERLAGEGWRTIAYDQRGHGDSHRAPDRDYALARFAEDAVDVLRSTAGAPVLVGASLGGLAGLLAAGELAPGCASALVLVDITPRMEPTGVERIVGFMLERVEHGFADLDEAADAVAAYQPHRPRPPSHEGLAKNLRRGPDGRWRWHWDPDLFLGPRPIGASSSSQRLVAAARRLDVPVLLVRGRLSDLVSEDTARELLELVPHARYVDVSGAGHMVAGDRNDAFTDAVASFLRGLHA